MDLVNKSVIEDCKYLVVVNRYSADDFDFAADEDPAPDAAQYARSAVVTILRKSTGISQRYRAADDAAWIEKFDLDLRRKAFDRR